jgi:AraC family transcriptional regulator
MDREVSARSREFEAVLAWIEDNLDRRLTLERIASHAGLSTYHFSRLFTIYMGRSVMAYVRHLRLIEAAKRIAVEPDLKLVELAMDSGFESQEAFTRSFRRTFGVSPGRLHLAYHLRAKAESRALHEAPKAGFRVEQLQELIHRESFTVTGLYHHYDDGTKLAIPGLRRRLARILTAAGRAVGETYGVISREGCAEGSFRYMAAVASDLDLLHLPELELTEVPAGSYLVFRIILAAGPVHPQIKTALQTIWDTLIPASGLSVNEAPDFEQYGPGFVSGQAGSVINYHVAVHLPKESLSHD